LAYFNSNCNEAESGTPEAVLRVLGKELLWRKKGQVSMGRKRSETVPSAIRIWTVVLAGLSTCYQPICSQISSLTLLISVIRELD
jgi:hypothetical protein